MLVVRGHIRNSFETRDLYDFIETIHSIFPDLEIFIHTWSVFANNLSWRKIDVNNEIVTEEKLHKYFGKFSAYIKHIIIDDDQNIQLHGNLNGKIGGNDGLMPIHGWKNYWYGKHKIIDYIYNLHKYDEEPLINVRFDLLSNSNRINKDFIVSFLKNNSNTTFKKNHFLFNFEQYGNDNIYMGNINTMHKLTTKFFYELDDILNKNSEVKNQEKLVYRINSLIFD